jgi:hypothetical protein
MIEMEYGKQNSAFYLFHMTVDDFTALFSSAIIVIFSTAAHKSHKPWVQTQETRNPHIKKNLH